MKTFYVGIKGIIVRDDRVLILKGSSPKDFWEVPGGRIDDDETVQQALLRELSEELPNIKDVRIHEILDAFRVHKDLVPGISLVLVFYRVEATFGGDPKISQEHGEYKWATQDEALKLVTESNKQAILRAMQARRIS